MSVPVPAGPDRRLGLGYRRCLSQSLWGAGIPQKPARPTRTQRPPTTTVPGASGHSLSPGHSSEASSCHLASNGPSRSHQLPEKEKELPRLCMTIFVAIVLHFIFLNILIKFVFPIQKVKLIYKFAIVPSIKFGHHSWFFLVFSMYNCVCATLWHRVFFIIMTKFTVLYPVPPS